MTNKGARDKPEWEDRFLELLAGTCNVSLSARGAGISRAGAHKRRKKNAAFRKAWDAAITEAIELLEAEAWQRAREMSDLLMMFLLKAHKPEKYYDKIKIEGGMDVTLVNAAIRALQKAGVDPAATFDAIIAEASRADPAKSGSDGA